MSARSVKNSQTKMMGHSTNALLVDMSIQEGLQIMITTSVLSAIVSVLGRQIWVVPSARLENYY